MMQRGTPHWALSSGVIKAFKHRHPLSLHMSALQSVCKKAGRVNVPSVVSLIMSFFPFSLFLTNAVRPRLGPL